MCPALRANSCIAIDRLMIELLDFHIPFLSFTIQGLWQELAEQKAENHSTSIDFNSACIGRSVKLAVPVTVICYFYAVKYPFCYVELQLLLLQPLLLVQCT